MKKITVDVGCKHNNTLHKMDRVLSIDDFEGLYVEDIQEKYPYLFFSGTSNTQAIHITIKDNAVIEEILRILGKNKLFSEQEVLTLSLLWNFPRRKYNETLIWACLTGCFSRKKDNTVISRFVVSNNIVSVKASEDTNNIINYINRCLLDK